MKNNDKTMILSRSLNRLTFFRHQIHRSFTNRKIAPAILLFSMATLLASCEKNVETTNLGDGTKANLKVSISEITFDDVQNFTNRSATPAFNMKAAPHETQISTTALNNDLILVSELEPVLPSNLLHKEYSRTIEGADRKAAISETDLDANIRYKLVVFDNTGLYVDERDYTRGSESSAPALQLDGGRQYTFVAYSINSTSALPAITFANPANKTLASATVNILNNEYFMYFNRSVTLVGNSTNLISVILKHRMSQVTTTIDASSTGYNITAVSANFTPNNPTATATLSNGAITQTGAATPANISFPTLGTQTIVATPTWINAAANSTTSLNLPSITIGPLTQTNLAGMSNLQITPGVKYNLKLNIVSNDEYLTVNLIPCTRINGVVWMQHNLSANYLIDGNSPSPGVSQQGYYYQFGRIAPTADPVGFVVTNPNYFNSPADNAWNTGSETTPAKTINDPCPLGFRVPTKTDYDKLVAGTTQTNIGTLNASATNYTRARVYSSIRKNGDIRLTFPAQGHFPTAGGGLPTSISGITNRGTMGYYWTSTVTSGRPWYFNFTSTGSSAINLASYGANKAEVYAMRCVAQ